MAKALVSVLSVVLTTAPLVARAQTPDAIGIRAQGMAGAFTAVADDATASWWNGAGLAAGPFANAIIEVGDDRHKGVSVAYPALGLSYYRLRISEIRAPASTGGSAAGRQDPGTADVRLRSLDASQFGATVGQSLGSHLVMASTLKLVRGGGSTHGGLDLGAMAVLGIARLGFGVRNVTGPTTLGEGDDAVLLRRHVRAGLALLSARRGAWGATLALDADVTKVSAASDDERRVAIGAEAWIPSHRLGGRGGVNWSTLGPVRASVSAGASVAIRSRTYFDVQVSHNDADASRRGVGASLRVTF